MVAFSRGLGLHIDFSPAPQIGPLLACQLPILVAYLIHGDVLAQVLIVLSEQLWSLDSGPCFMNWILQIDEYFMFCGLCTRQCYGAENTCVLAGIPCREVQVASLYHKKQIEQISKSVFWRTKCNATWLDILARPPNNPLFLNLFCLDFLGESRR